MLKVQFVTVSFHTFGWMQNLISSIFTYFPYNILVIDNNPTEEDVGSTFTHSRSPGSTFESDYAFTGVNFAFNDKVKAEREWLLNHGIKVGEVNITNRKVKDKNDEQRYKFTHCKQTDLRSTYVPPVCKNRLSIIQNKGYHRKHGSGLEIAKHWCLHNNIDVMCHVEPDVGIEGVRWFYDQLSAIENGAWHAGSWYKRAWGSAAELAHIPYLERPTYSALDVSCCSWLLDPIKNIPLYSANMGGDQSHPKFNEITYSDHAITNNYWDTAHKAWFHCYKHNKVALTSKKDVKHLDHSCSLKDYE